LYPKIPVEGDTRSLKFQTCIHSNTVLRSKRCIFLSISTNTMRTALSFNHF
jgi:hypothetical protein